MTPFPVLFAEGGSVIVSDSLKELVFGAEAGDPAIGIHLKRTGYNPKGFKGKTSWVQLITEISVRRHQVDGPWERLKASPGLDSVYPYNRSQTEMSDAPAANLDELHFIRVEDSTDYRVFLMFEPTGVPGKSMPVPIRKRDWNWYGSAEWIDGKWKRLSGGWDSAADKDTTTAPEWTHNTGDDIAANEYENEV